MVLQNNPYIDKLSAKDAGDLPTDPLAWQNWFRDRAKEYDRFYNLSSSIENRLALIRLQPEFYWPASVRRKICGVSYLAMAHDICEVPHEYAPGYFPTEDEFMSAAATKTELAGKRRVIGWVVAGSRIDKIHPYSAMIIARLIKELHAPVIMFGSATERELTSAQAIHDQVQRQNGSNVDLHLAMSPGPHHQSWPLRRSLALLQQCDMVIGPDTGPLWSVAMKPMPKIVMLGHASATNITTGWINTISLAADPARVPCSPCHLLHETPDTCVPDAQGIASACMTDISSERIIETAAELWKVTDEHSSTQGSRNGGRVRGNGEAERGRHPGNDSEQPRRLVSRRGRGNGEIPARTA